MGGSHSRGRIHESKGNIRRTGKADRARRGRRGECLAVVVVRVYNDDARANFKEAYRACSSPARNILSASLAFRAGHQTLLSPATKRFTPFQTRCSAPTARQPNGKQTERKEEKHRQKSHFLSKYTPQEIPLSGNDTLSICRGDILRKVTIPLLLRCFDLPRRFELAPSLSDYRAFTRSFHVSDVNEKNIVRIFSILRVRY